MKNSNTPRRSNSALFALLALLALSAWVSGCHWRATEVVLRVETDMDQGPARTLTAVRVEIRTPGSSLTSYRNTFQLGTSSKDPLLPADLGITPRGNDPTRIVAIDVTAIHDGVDLFTYQAIIPFEKERTNELRVFLADRCRDPANRCDPGYTCGRDGCERVDRTSLPLFDAAAYDARIDATARDATPDGACAAGRARCPASSASCNTDVTAATNCGACGNVCPTTRPLCTASGNGYACASACSGATPTSCGAECVNTMTDPLHCGACDRACPVPTRGVASCAGGVCGVSCDTGYHACDNNTRCADDRSVASCGGACSPCPTPPNATPTCTAVGQCSSQCEAGFGDCTSAAGCETALSSPSSCGACGRVCPANAPLCVPGVTGGYSCSTMCVPRVPCHPGGNECVDGETSCATPTSQPVCAMTSYVAAGKSCAGGVCNGGGVCNPCVEGASCPRTNVCERGQVVCSSGQAVCTNAGANVGAGCGNGGRCNALGGCDECQPGKACTAPNDCYQGSTVCVAGASMCANGTPLPPNTPCSIGVCDGAGRCKSASDAGTDSGIVAVGMDGSSSF